MKTSFHLSLCAIVFITLVSCTKSKIANNVGTVPVEDHFLYSSISHFTNDPAAMELGNPESLLNTGDRITIYLPFATDDGNPVNKATLTVIDDATGEVINEFTMLHSSDPSAASLNKPEGLADTDFMFVTFDLDADFTGKVIKLTSTMTSLHKTSNDVLNSAFSVL